MYLRIYEAVKVYKRTSEIVTSFRIKFILKLIHQKYTNLLKSLLSQIRGRRGRFTCSLRFMIFYFCTKIMTNMDSGSL